MNGFADGWPAGFACWYTWGSCPRRRAGSRGIAMTTELVERAGMPDAGDTSDVEREVITVRGARVHNLKNIGLAPAQQTDGHHRRFGFGQIVARVRHDLRRRPAAIRRIAVGIRTAVPRTDGQARRRRDHRHLRRRSRSGRRIRPTIRARPSPRRPRSTITCGCSSPAPARRSATSAAAKSRTIRPNPSPTRSSQLPTKARDFTCSFRLPDRVFRSKVRRR